MRKIIVVSILLCISLVLGGCGKEESSGVFKDLDNINEKTKVISISESYAKYTELKSTAYEKLSDQISNDENFNFSISMGLLGFSTLDISLIPISFCGLDNEAAIAGLGFLYKDIDYKNTDKECQITFKTDEGILKYVSEYDISSDSVKTTVYENDKLSIISEYVKLNQGYATQFYSIDDNESTVYKSIFDDDKIIVSFKSDTEEPKSIYRNKSIADEEWTKSEELWAKYENGNVTSIYEGVEY